MQGDPKVIDALNGALKIELTAVNQFFLHARLLEHWGFPKRGRHEMKESLEEMRHADMLIQRILLLEGLPNLQDLGKLYVGENLKEVIECDLRLEREALSFYREVVGLCEQVRDYVSRDLMAKLLADEEEHEHSLTTELELIEQLGLANYAQSQMGDAEAE